MKELVVLALALSTTSTLGVEHQPRNNSVPHNPRVLVDISSLETLVEPAKDDRKSRQVDAMACGSTNVLNFGEYAMLESPNYPRRYPNNIDCSWELVIPAGAEVFFSCESFRVRRGDYFTLGDYSFYGKYSTGFYGYQVELLDTQTSLQLGFTSDRRRRSRGFR